MKRGVALLLLLAALICMSSIAHADEEPENLLEDEFFDEWKGDENNELAVWSNEHADRENETVLKGNYSAGRDAGHHEYYYHPTVDIEEGVDYHMEVWVYAENGTESVETGIHLSEEFGSMERINDSGNMKVEPKEEWINHTWSWQATEKNISFAVRNHGDFNDSYMYIGAAWLGTEQPQEDWIEIGEEEENGDEDDDQEENETDDKEERIEINSASQGELEKIKHIGESRAEWIKENCDSFYSLAQLVYVKGLGEKTTKEIIKEGKAYVLPPGENWDLSEDPCSEEDEEEGDDEDCEEVVREVTVVEEETIYKEREFELIGHDETVEQGSGISADLLIRNDENQAKNYTIYSYVYDNNRVFTTGNWTSNRKTVEMEGNEKRVVGLENTVEEDAPLGLHDFRVRVRDEKDLDSEVNITESEDIEDKKVVENKTEVNMTEENVTEENVTPEKETVPETPAGRTFESPTPLEEVWLGFLDLLGL